VGELLSNVDVAPTLLEAAGAPIPSAVQGRSFLPLLRGGAYEPRSEVYAEKTFHSYYDPIRAIRTHGHKLIRNWETTYEVEAPADVQEGAIFRSAPLRYHGRVHPELELYDLESDPLELRNLAEDPANAGLALELDGRLWTWMERTDDPLLRGPVPSPAHGRSLAARPAEANPAAG
jgi:arylsulfatase A-like enzyme